MKPFRIALSVAVLTGCAGLIGVPDLNFDDKADQGTPDGSAGSSGTNGTSGGVGADGAPGTLPDGAPIINCDQSKIQTDKANCGRCGHDCQGGECQAGVCKATALATVGGAPLSKIVEHGNSLYVSTVISLTTQNGGIWKVPKTTGSAVPFVTLRYAQDMVVVGDTLYFAADDTLFDDAGSEGGLWSCDLNGPTPCVPRLVAAADTPQSVSVTSDGKIYYTDGRDTKGIMQYVPPAAPTVFRPGFGFAPKIWVGGQSAYYMVTIFEGPETQRAVLFEAFTDGGVAEIDRYTKQNQASDGMILGTDNALYFTAWDYETSTGGAVRRRARPGTPGIGPCDYGKDTNKRPYGLYLDATNVYWANQGTPTDPYPDGSIAYCALDPCCDVPTTLWTGNGEPDAITGDATALYWVTYRTGEVWKIAKP